MKKGSKVKLNFEVESTGAFLKWDFKVHNNDIKFGVRAVNINTGEKFNEIDLKRISFSESEETGFVECQVNHKCNYFLLFYMRHWHELNFVILDTVCFDNSYSYFKNKKITYSVVMMKTPLDEIEKSASKIEEDVFDQNENQISAEWNSFVCYDISQSMINWETG